MDLVRIRHKGLRQLYWDDVVKGVPPSALDKLRKLLLSLEAAESLDQVSRYPGWRLHPLRGDKKGMWSLSVTGNLRLTFHYDEPTNTASDLDLVDYH